jgi:hypothetical protein
MFVKHGDGKIVSVLDADELTEEQKKALKDMSNKKIKTSSEDESNPSENKKSGS